jgi:hypothetical protein
MWETTYGVARSRCECVCAGVQVIITLNHVETDLGRVKQTKLVWTTCTGWITLYPENIVDACARVSARVNNINPREMQSRHSTLNTITRVNRICSM